MNIYRSKTIILVALLLTRVVSAQECLIDGKRMYSIGSSEIVNGELLALFRCDDGHQMWLANYDQENKQKHIDTKTVDVKRLEPVVASDTVTLLASAIKESENSSLTSKNELLPVPITKKETVLKIGTSSANYINDINIKKFGLETLLHKKIESDRIFAEEIEEEKNELLYIMNTQKRLFELAERKNLKFRPLENPLKFSIYVALSVFLLISL